MKRAAKKRSGTKSKVIPETVKRQIFAGYCEGAGVHSLGDKFRVHPSTIHEWIKKDNWEEKRRGLQLRIEETFQDRLIRTRANESTMGLVIRDSNIQRMMLENESYRTTGRMPSYLGSNVHEYKQALELANILIEGHGKEIKVKGQLQANMNVMTPKEALKMMEMALRAKGMDMIYLDDLTK